jgi:hypothetical protein
MQQNLAIKEYVSLQKSMGRLNVYNLHNICLEVVLYYNTTLQE